MADKRINALANTAPNTASDDFIAIDGTTNGTRKLNAFSPTFGGNATVTGTLTGNSTITGANLISSVNSGAANGSEFTAFSALVGTDASLGPCRINIGALPSATFSSRYGYIACYDGGDYRKLYLGGSPGIAATGGQILIPATIASTTTSSGALVVSGGVGVAGAAYFGGTVTVASNFNIASTGFYAGGGTPGAGRFLYSATAGTMLCGQAGSSYDLSLASSTGTVILGVPTGTSNLEAAGSVKTAAPSGGTAAAWKLGTVATVSPTSPNRTIEVDIGGTIYYIHAKTTNN